MSGASHLPAGLSDDSLLEIRLPVGKQRVPGTWRLAPHLGHDKVDEVVSPLQDSYWSTNVNTASPKMVWDAFKATTRWHYICAVKAVRTEYALLTTQLKSAEVDAAESFAGHPTQEA